MPSSIRIAAVAFLSANLIAGCAIYHPLPLPSSADVAIQVPAGTFDMAKTAAFAVDHSPALIAERRKSENVQAQAHAAGLLTDPQLSGSIDRPTPRTLGLVNAYSLALGLDLQSLLTEPWRARGAAAKITEAKLNLLWSEWQTIQEAAKLYADVVFNARKTELLTKTNDILLAQSNRSQQALDAHNSTIDVAGADLSAALDIASQADAAARSALTAEANLKALMGVSPQASLELAELGDPPIIAKDEVEQALSNLVRVRPDLLALQAGYHAQNDAVRAAILEQFPAINVSFNRASDTSDVHTRGLSVTLNLPIFGNAQAKIRAERATRAQLRAEYQARLDQTAADAWRIWRGLELLRPQMHRLIIDLPALRTMALTGQRAYEAGNLPPATYVLLQSSLSAREAEWLDLQATQWSDTIALRTLLGILPLVPNSEIRP